MGWRLRKTFRLGRFFNLNLSNRGVGWSAGIPGFRYVDSPRARRVASGQVPTSCGCLIILFAAFFMACVLPSLFVDRRTPSAPAGERGALPTVAPPPATSLQPGDTATLGPGLYGVWLATDREDLAEVEAAEARRNGGGPAPGSALYQLADAGRARIYPGGSRVVVLGVDGAAARVEVLDGEDRGRSGWVRSSYLAAEPRPSPGVAPSSSATVAVEPAEPDAQADPSRSATDPPFRSMLDAQRDEEKAAAEATKAEADRKRAARAKSLMASAKNLERAGKTAGAIGFYRTIVRDLAGTPQAKEAAARIEALKGR